MIDLDEMVLSRVREVLGIISEGGVSHREVSSMARQVEADYHGRLLIELLQNANDQVERARQNGGRVEWARQDGDRVEIHRTRELLVVGNGGLPFDDEGIRTLTALGLSEKDPNTLIGNKGIGFKSVFEVTVSPEIYSAPASGGTIRDQAASRFRLSQEPFSEEDGERRLDALIQKALQDNPHGAQKLGSDQEEKLKRAVREAAPFKFPIQLPQALLEARLESISIGDPLPASLIVLPLKESPGVNFAIDRALDEILDSDGAFILFLPGVSELRVVDQVRGCEVLIEKSEMGREKDDSTGVSYSIRRLATTKNGKPSIQAWHVVETLLGGEEKLEDSERLRAASKSLPGSNQAKIHQVPVAVALPERGSRNGLLLGPDGKFCIGLPTKDSTGTPAWIHAHFFGKISRQGLTFDLDFNRILLEEATKLHGFLIKRLQRDQRFEIRRLATLAFERGHGPLADWLFEKSGGLSDPIILTDDGITFAGVAEIVLPKPERIEIVSDILQCSSSVRFDLPKLPHRSFIEDAREFLFNLCKGVGPVPEERFLKRDWDGSAPLERVADHRRKSGPRFWSEFFEYAFEICGPNVYSQLGSLRILPVQTNRLVAADEVVFLPPAVNAESGKSSPPLGNTADLVEEAEVDFSAFEAMPQDVVDRLNILDGEEIPARREDGRSLTAEAARLAPEKGDGLVRRAQRVEMILRGIVPAMGELGTTECDLLTGLQLLRIVARWIANVSEDGSSKVRRSIRVPVVSEEGWCWEIADRVYFGEGWASKHESLLLQAYGDIPRRLLVPFPDLKFSGAEESVAEWREIMETVGVHGRPRVIRTRAGKGFAQFIALRGTYTLSVNESPPCPLREIEDIWVEYLQYCAGRPTTVSSNYTYRFLSLSWIEGLERERSRRAIIEMVLKDPRSYLEFTESEIGRADGGSDKSVHDSPWVWTIKNGDWKCIPTDRGLLRPSESWLIRRRIESERNGRLRFLAGVSREFLSADTLLRHLGVPDWDNPDLGALLRELERCAEHIRDSGTSQYLLGQLVEELYDRIDRALGQGAADVEMTLGIRLLPLLRSGNLEGVVPSELEAAYVDDDSDRLAFLRLRNDILVWPFTIREGSAKGHALVHQIRRSFGERAAILVSEVEVPTGFEASGQPDSLRGILGALNVPDPSVTLLDLACLLCMGKSGLSPADPEFGLSWRQFNLLKVVRGKFPASVSAKHFFYFRDGGPVLEIGDTCHADDLLENLWRLGIERDLLSAYVRSFQKNQIPSFFDERRFSSSRREDVRLEVSEFSIDQREEVRSAIFAVRRKLRGEDVVEFGNEWLAKCESGEEFSKWLGAPFSEGRLEECLAASTQEERSLAVLRLGGVEIAAWQEARRALGMMPHHFNESGQLWRRLLRQVGAILKAWVARRLNSDLDSARLQIVILSDLQPPDSVLEATPDVSGTLLAVIEMAERLFRDEGNRSIWGRPLELLRRVEPAGSVSSSSIQIGDEAPQRDVNEYLDTPEAERVRRAKEWCGEYLRIAASLEGIEHGLESLMTSGQLRSLTEGFWANRFSMIPVLQEALADAAPGALAIMKDKGTFKRTSDFSQLRDCFPEIKPKGPQPGVVIATPESRVRIFGREVSEDQIPALLRGDGELAKLLVKSLEDECFNPSTDLVRENAFAPVLSTKIGSRGRRSHQGLKETQSVKNLIGQIGEFYVYKWLIRECPESVDQECWISSNRTAFLECEDGDDSVGYDFTVAPGDERFSGRDDGPRILIEVKSKSEADDGHFYMTATEWRRAAEASADPTEEYWVLVVQNVLESPHIAQVIKDPHRLMAEGKLVFQHESLSVRVGEVRKTEFS